ncbi:hypothetical protein FB45DRAFT_914807 [Roridomyces roridus]|uniref:Uncharacterized protein n=1 Tax=Roridomyces roridus TaxID=1738132 RepID=A0AAD7BXV8_9AGAR|nr:hypothetical protein FB45DRAFT_914807 [Roridomyces roridus]
MDPLIQSTISRVIRLPGVRSLRVDCIDKFPSALLRYGVYALSQLTILGDLSLDETDQTPGEDSELITNVGPLQKLHMAIVGQSADRLSSYAFMRRPDVRSALYHLSWICVALDRDGWDFLNDSELFRNLTELVVTWAFFHNDAQTVHPLHLPSLPNLRQISLHIILSSTGMGVLEFIGTSITLAERTPALEDLRLIFSPLDAPVGGEQPPKPIPFFDDASYAQKLPCLRQIRCLMTEVNPMELEDFTAYMAAVFPAPLKAGILACGIQSGL